eukprot:12577988-Alexandrium_andersonii.AAC.1
MLSLFAPRWETSRAPKQLATSSGVKEAPRARCPSSTPVAACDASMVVGDLNAVGYGMGAHLAVLRHDPE